MSKISTYFLFVLMGLPILMWGQDSTKTSTDFSCEFVSRYVWRGLNLGGNTPSIQPTASLVIEKKNSSLSLGTFGAYSMGGQMLQEADIYLTYTWNELISLTLTDYFFPLDDAVPVSYFNYEKDATGHVFEGTVQYNGSSKVPFSLLFAMNLYGADAASLNPDSSKAGIQMSKYVELAYTKELSNVDMKLFLGAALNAPDVSLGETGFYGNEKAGIINVGCKLSKELTINDHFSLPVQTQLIFNPLAGRVHMVFGFTL